jgi:hypothetical protein
LYWVNKNETIWLTITMTISFLTALCRIIFQRPELTDWVSAISGWWYCVIIQASGMAMAETRPTKDTVSDIQLLGRNFPSVDRITNPTLSFSCASCLAASWMRKSAVWIFSLPG